MNNAETDLDNQTFLNALAEFTACAAKLPPVIDHPELLAKLTVLCGILKIARCEGTFYKKNIFSYNVVDKDTAVFFTDVNYDPDRKLNFTYNSNGGNSVCYTVYPYNGSPDFSENDKINIGNFISSLYLANERSRAVIIAENLENYDNETNTYNSKFFFKTLSELAEKGVISEYCACRYNLKNFSAVNSKIGRHYGTSAMRRHAAGLKDVIGKDGIVSRMGGDNFIALFKKEKLRNVQDYLPKAIIRTDSKECPDVTISAYAGYYPIMKEHCGPDDVLENTLSAMNRAKNNVNCPYVIFDEKSLQENFEKKRVEDLFSDAIDNEEFLVYYQPKTNLETYTLTGAEALCRWKHDGEIIPPFRFIPVLEQSSKICILDFYMLEHVCRDIRRWIDSGMSVVTVSVNLSRLHLGNEGLSEQILGIIDKYNIPHEYIEIELTETTTDVDFKELKQIVGDLHDAGVHTSVDDFGVGYSSLNLIRDLPWNVLKIDKSFLPEDRDSNKGAKSVMLKCVITMARSLGLECIVEGVETAKQVLLLKNFGCYLAQGYYFDKPLEVVEFEKRLRGEVLYKNPEKSRDSEKSTERKSLGQLIEEIRRGDEKGVYTARLAEIESYEKSILSENESNFLTVSMLTLCCNDNSLSDDAMKAINNAAKSFLHRSDRIFELTDGRYVVFMVNTSEEAAESLIIRITKLFGKIYTAENVTVKHEKLQ